VSPAAACVAVEGPPRRTPTTATRIETNTSVDVDEPETYAQEIDEDTRLVEWEYDEDREGFIPVLKTDSRTTMTLHRSRAV